MYEPKPERQFSFGLWTGGSVGRDPFGDPVRAALTPVNPVHLLAEVGACGAVLLAGVAAGAWPDGPAACSAAVRVTSSTQPDPCWTESYRQAYPVYQSFYPALPSSFEEMQA
jgi:sugar (pentulose or hexulose) kinase